MINIPESPKEVEQRAKTDVQRELPESNPFLKNSFLGAIISAFSLRIFDFYIQLRQLIKEMFIQTATGDFLRMFGAWWGITENPATQGTGDIVITGTATTNIPIGTTLQSSDGIQYETQSTVVIANNVLNVLSITRSGSTATVTTDGNHNLSSFVEVTIAGAGESEYNITTDIQVTGLDTFTYTVSGTPASPATGTITVANTSINVAVTSVDYGQSTNQTANAPLSFTTPIAGADNTAYVGFGEIGGGTDAEAEDDYRGRIIDRVQNPVAHFNANAIINQAKLVPGVTRVFVFETTPALGQVTIYFTRDNDVSIIPSAGEITSVKNKILEIKPANTSDVDVIVDAPTPVSVNFTFTGLTPNTPGIQAAVSANLTALFFNSSVGVNVEEQAYLAAIFQTIDRETGDRVESFALSAPSGAIAVATGELAVLGMVTYP